VARVGVLNGRAVGVELENGTRIGARAVVSGAHPQTTYLDLVGEEHLPEEVVRKIRRYRTR
jgi:phytoene dehydrogenase-like protein